MSIENCQLTCRDGKLCCTPQTICVKDCAWTVTVRGGPFDVCLFPTGNTNEGTVVYGTTPVDGQFTVAEPGTYTVCLDCDALDGTECPDPLTAPYVCWHENCINGLLELQILEALEALCAKIELGDDGAALAEIITNLEAICEKLLANGDVQASVLAELQALCAKMLEAIAALESVCGKLEATNETLADLCAKIEAMAADLIGALEALCEKTDKTNTLLDALCKKIEAQTALLATELAAILVCLGALKVEQAAQGITLDSMLVCFEQFKKEQLEQGTTLDEILECLKKSEVTATVVECCTGGLIPGVTDVCFNVPISFLTGGGEENCTYSLFGQELPSDYTQAMALALLPAGSTAVPNPNNSTQMTICTAATVLRCYSRTCLTVGEGGGLGQISRVCWVALPNTAEPECANFQRTWGKYEEPIANTLETSLAVQEEMLQKLCDNKPYALKDMYSCTGITGNLRNREWIIGPRPTGIINNEQGQAIVAAGIPEAEPDFETDWTQLGGNDTNHDATTQDVQLIEGFIKVEEPTYMRWANGTAGYSAIYLGVDCGAEELVAEGSLVDADRNPTNVVFIPRGIHSYKLWMVDDWSFNNLTAQFSADGVAFANAMPDTIQLSKTKPVETKKCVKITCNPTALADALTGEELSLEDCYADAYLPETGGSADAEILEKLCAANDMAEEALIKQCLLDDFWMNCADEPRLLETLDKEAGELCLDCPTNKSAQYAAGTTIALKDELGNVCGSATATGENTWVEGKLTVGIEECELAEGKTPAVVKTAKPVLTATVGAVKAVVKGIKLSEVGAVAGPVRGPVTPTPTGPTILFPRTTDIVIDNFQDGNGNAPFNLQIRDNVGADQNFQVVTPTVPYETIPELRLPEGVEHTATEVEGGFQHSFTGKLASRQAVTITGGVPEPAGRGGANTIAVYGERA